MYTFTPFPFVISEQQLIKVNVSSNSEILQFSLYPPPPPPPFLSRRLQYSKFLKTS